MNSVLLSVIVYILVSGSQLWAMSCKTSLNLAEIKLLSQEQIAQIQNIETPSTVLYIRGYNIINEGDESVLYVKKQNDEFVIDTIFNAPSGPSFGYAQKPFDSQVGYSTNSSFNVSKPTSDGLEIPQKISPFNLFSQLYYLASFDENPYIKLGYNPDVDHDDKTQLRIKINEFNKILVELQNKSIVIEQLEVWLPK